MNVYSNQPTINRDAQPPPSGITRTDTSETHLLTQNKKISHRHHPNGKRVGRTNNQNNQSDKIRFTEV
jgi:hypothetical protein